MNQNNQNQNNQHNQQKPKWADVLDIKSYDTVGHLANVPGLEPTKTSFDVTCSECIANFHDYLKKMGLTQSDIADITHQIGVSQKTGQPYVGFYVWFNPSPKIIAGGFNPGYEVAGPLAEKMQRSANVELTEEIKRILFPFVQGNFNVGTDEKNRYVGVELNEFLVIGHRIKFNSEVAKIRITSIEHFPGVDKRSGDAIISVEKELLPKSEINKHKNNNAVNFDRMTANNFRR